MNVSQIRSLLRLALKEDLGTGDLTTQALIPRNQRAGAIVVAKEPGIFAGGLVAREVFRLRDSHLQVKLLVKEGRQVKKGQNVMMIRGRSQSILEAERTALNFLGRLSGIATLTRRYVDKVRGTNAKIYDTRKTTPLWRDFEKCAVRSGGGENHRFGLFDEVLVKDNHWAAILSLRGNSTVILNPPRFCGGRRIPRSFGPPRSSPLGSALRMTRAFHALAMTRRRRRIPIEFEVKNLKELARLLENPFVPDRILLDNFSIRELRRAVLFVEGLNFILKSRYGIRLRTTGARLGMSVGTRRAVPLLEASGRVTLQNVRRVAQTGVERISVGRLTHSAPTLDFSLRLVKTWP